MMCDIMYDVIECSFLLFFPEWNDNDMISPFGFFNHFDVTSAFAGQKISNHDQLLGSHHMIIPSGLMTPTWFGLLIMSNQIHILYIPSCKHTLLYENNYHP